MGLFDEFNKVTKEQWLDKIKHDLKDRPLSSLEWEVDGLRLQPFHHWEDNDMTYDPIPIKGEFRVGQTIHIQDHQEANKIALKDLEGGTNSIYWIFDSLPSINNLTDLFNGIHLDWIDNLVCFPKTKFMEGIQIFNDYREIHAGNPFDITAVLEDHDQILDLDPASKFAIQFPSNSKALAVGCKYAEKGHTPGNISFILPSDEDYFKNICTLRAFRLVWSRIMELMGQLGISKISTLIDLVFYCNEEMNNNTIKATTIAIGSMIGGASQVFIAPSDANINVNGNTNSRRTARNINHLLVEESHLTKVHDAGAGSYFIEHLTDKIAFKLWSEFQNHMSNATS